MAQRTLREEYQMWVSWRDKQPGYMAQKGLNHNRPMYGLVLFPFQQGWISKNILWIILLFALEVIALFPLQIMSGNKLGNPVIGDFILIGLTIIFLEYKVWHSSKLVFVSFLPILLFIILIAIAYTNPGLIL